MRSEACLAAFVLSLVLSGCGDPGSPDHKSDAVIQRGANRPFPQHVVFPGAIRPSHLSQAQLDQAVTRRYRDWKAAYVRASNGVTPGGGTYIEMVGVGADDDTKTTSEAHGYGMLVFALMAGHDPEAQKLFDGMVNLFDHHRSTINPELMSWVIADSESSGGDGDSATDGDMDIAYALLLADRQWGSQGPFDYLAMAKRMITRGIKASEMGSESLRPKLGDWDDSGWNTRTSDWMPGHFRAFQAATGDSFWSRAADTVFALAAKIREGYAPSTGLMPDFVVDRTPRPAPPRFLERETDGDYSWNACRYPWRLATDALHNESAQARAALQPLLRWVKSKTGGDPEEIKAGYTLDGDMLVSYGSLAFTGPILAAAATDVAHQSFLNAGWDHLESERVDYYDDTIALLTMLLISGSWWAP